MILTITYAGENATDLGFLLHKSPFRVRRRHGGETVRFCGARTTRAGATGDQVPRQRVFENHLRAGIFAAGKSGPIAESQRGDEEVVGASRICAGD